MKAFEVSPKDGYFFVPSSSLPIPDPGFAESIVVTNVMTI
jgi:hypothetical protein